MSTTINVHRTTRVTATFGTGHASAWVDLHFLDGDGQRLTVTAFFEDHAYARDLADAVNLEAAIQARLLLQTKAEAAEEAAA